MTKNNEKWEGISRRLDAVNELVKFIGNNGRRFFFDPRKNTYAHMSIFGDNRLYWVDEGSGKSIYLHYKYWGKGFTNGGTLKSLVDHFRRFVVTGQMLPEEILGPWPSWYGNGDLWGYGESMRDVRAKAAELGLLPQSVTLVENLQIELRSLRLALTNMLIEFPPIGPSCGCDESGHCVWHKGYALVPEMYYQAAAGVARANGADD